MHDEDTEITSDDLEEDFDDDTLLSASERKKLDLKKIDAKRKLEDYLENRKLEKEWGLY